MEFYSEVCLELKLWCENGMKIFCSFIAWVSVLLSSCCALLLPSRSGEVRVDIFTLKLAEVWTVWCYFTAIIWTKMNWRSFCLIFSKKLQNHQNHRVYRIHSKFIANSCTIYYFVKISSAVALVRFFWTLLKLCSSY